MMARQRMASKAGGTVLATELSYWVGTRGDFRHGRPTSLNYWVVRLLRKVSPRP